MLVTTWLGMDAANFVWSFLIYRRKMKLKSVLTKQIDFLHPLTLSEVRTYKLEHALVVFHDLLSRPYL